MDVQLPDGTVIKGVPDGTTKADLVQKLQSNGMQVPKEWMSAAPAAAPKPAAPGSEGAEAETALKLGTGFASTVGGGIAGLARGAGAGIASLAQGEGFRKAGEAFTSEAVDTIHNVAEAGTYQPRSEAGKAASEAIEKPFVWIAGKANQAGEAVSSATGSPALGALANTAVQSLPALVGKGAGMAARAVRGAGTAEELSASGAPRQPPSETGDFPRGTAQEAPGAAQAPPGGTQTPPHPNTARAQAYASRIGLDWTRLGAGTRKALETIAQDSAALDRLNPAAVKRQAHLEGLRVPVAATRGQLERDPVQLRREAIASNTSEGQPIRDTDIAANRDLQANLEVLRGRVGGLRGGTHEPLTEEGAPAATPSIRAATKTPNEVGEAAQAAARQKATFSKKAYQALYKRARETEPEAQVPLKPVTDLLTTNPEIQHLGWVTSWLNKAAKAKGGPEGEGVALTDAKLGELHDLRSTANDIARTGGKEGYYAGQVVKAIDQTMEAAPAGAKAWKAANEAFKRHQQEFKDQGIVAKLVSQKKGGADRALAVDRTWKQIASGSTEQIRQVKKTLLTGGTAATRTAGRAAWRDLRAETVNRILEDARNVTSADETERAILTETALRRSMNRIPRENLKEMIGPGAVRELDGILRARRITTRSPVGGRTTQSGTVPNALVLFEKVLKHIPGAKYVVGAKHAVQELGERGGAARAAQEAVVSPLEQAARDVERTSRSRARWAAFRTLEQSGPTLPSGPPPQPLPIGPAMRPQQ